MSLSDSKFGRLLEKRNFCQRKNTSNNREAEKNKAARSRIKCGII